MNNGIEVKHVVYECRQCGEFFTQPSDAHNIYIVNQYPVVLHQCDSDILGASDIVCIVKGEQYANEYCASANDRIPHFGTED